MTQPKRDRTARRISHDRDRAIANLQTLTGLPTRTEQKRVHTIADLQRLTPHTVDDLVRRAQSRNTPDSYPPSSISEGTGRSGTVTNRTLSAVEKRAGGRIIEHHNGIESYVPDTWRAQADPVRDSIHAIAHLIRRCRIQTIIARRNHTTATEQAAAIRQAQKLAEQADTKREYVTARQLERQSSVGACKACDRTVLGTADDQIAGTTYDQLRAGYCAACYRAWTRLGRPDRIQFERSRRERQAC